MRVLVIGAGRMGSQIGCEYAIGGHVVTFVARDSAAAGTLVDAALEMSGRIGLFMADARHDVRSRILVTADPELDPAPDLVVESVRRIWRSRLPCSGRWPRRRRTR
jgi:3-hydroxyacyl-CoA dehydrogenase